MAHFKTDPAALALGHALASLRRAKGLSQAEAASRLGMTSQGWGQYEAGRRPGLFRPDVQRRITAALGATPEALHALAAAPAPAAPGFASPAAVYEPGHAPVAAQRLQLSNDDLAPWAASGVVVAFEPGRWPRRDQGCVIHMTSGEIRVRLYDRADGDTLYVRGGAGGLAGEERVPRAEVAQVSAVTGRFEF